MQQDYIESTTRNFNLSHKIVLRKITLKNEKKNQLQVEPLYTNEYAIPPCLIVGNLVSYGIQVFLCLTNVSL